jgi:hypothetical protein
MDDLDDPALKEVLSRARRGWSPTAGEIERVRRGVETALATGIPAAPPAAPGTPAWVRHVLVTAAFTAAGAGAGYWAGRRATPPAPAAVSAVRVIPTAPRSPAPAPVLEPPAPAVAAPPPARRIDRARHASVATPPPATPAESLAVEVRALRNIERALRDGNPGLAQAFLDDLDRAVPGGQMREERSALRTIARCNAGQQPFGLDLADEFTAAYPSSAYRARVQQACGTDSHSAGDSSSRR